MSYESLHIFKLIKIYILYNFLPLWIFFLQFSTLLKIKQYQLHLMISVQIEKKYSSPFKVKLLKLLSINWKRPVKALICELFQHNAEIICI